MTTRIKLLISDLDGTITNGHMVFDHEGNVSKGYHTRDITGLWQLLNADPFIDVLVLTGSNHACDRHRFAFLADPQGVFETRPVKPLEDVLAQSVHDKAKYIQILLDKRKLTWDEVAFIGDAENDLVALKFAGWSACPSDAHDDIKTVVHNVMHYPGGNGALREFTDLVIYTMERIRNAPNIQ